MLHFLEQAAQTGHKAVEKLTVAHVSRRGFLATTTAGFAVAAFAGDANAFARYKTGGDSMPHGLRYDPHLFVAIDADGTVTLTAHRSEMGTGSRTSLPMILADEMGADWAKVKRPLGMSLNTATRTLMDHVLSATTSRRCARWGRLSGICWRRRRLTKQAWTPT